MADEERPEGSGGGGEPERGKKGKTQGHERSPAETPQSDAASSTGSQTSVAPSAAHAEPAPTGDSSVVYAPPAPGSASMDSGRERGISGALALWGPLIIIGFLVLVLNTDDAPGRAPVTEAPTISPPAEPEASVEVPPAPETASVAAVPAEPAVDSTAPVPAAVPEAESVASVTPPAAPATGEGAVLTAPETVVAAVEEPLPEAAENAGRAGDLDLDAVPEVARSVIGQGGGETASETGGAEQPAPPPAVPEVSVAASTESKLPKPPKPAAAGVYGVATGISSAPQPDYEGAYPVWSSGAGAPSWAATPSSQGDAMWGSGTAESGSAAGGPDWPPPPASAAAMPPLHPGPAMAAGSGYWPRPPVLVPCAPPYYWCIALPASLYNPAPVLPYQ